MIWKIIFSLTCLNVLVIAPRTQPSQSSSSSANQQEYLEELYIEPTLVSLNFMTTLAKKEVKFEEGDITLLTEECYNDEDCLIQKGVSVKKFNRKMQAIQCVHGLLVLKVLDELKAIMCDRYSRNISELKELLQEPVSTHKRYLTSMLALINMAKWEPYAWQIEMFTFVEGLAARDANFNRYKKYFAEHHQSRRENVLSFVRKCVQHKYLMYEGNTTSEDLTISRLVDRVYSQMESYLKSPLIVFYRRLGLYRVEYLMLQNLYTRHDFIFDWSMFKQIKLQTNNVKDKLRAHSALYMPQQLYHVWELDPIGGNKYNALIAKCIQLRLVYFVWYHLHIYNTLKNRTMDEDALEFWRETPLWDRMWRSLVQPLSTALRLFRFSGNIYWSAIRFMMKDFNDVSKDELAIREEYTRNYFCQAVEDLELASASDINQQLINIKVANDHDSMYDEIKANSNNVPKYTADLMAALEPVDGTFVRLIVSAEGNENFVLPQNIVW